MAAMVTCHLYYISFNIINGHYNLSMKLNHFYSSIVIKINYLIVIHVIINMNIKNAILMVLCNPKMYQ